MAARKTAAAPANPPAAATVTAMVPLIDLYIHPLNTRSEPPVEDITALAESIRAIGLMQNLMGYTQSAPGGSIGIVAGGRRLRAIRLLHDAGLMGDDPFVPVLLTGDEDTARLWASAENTARSALHPADEVRAYGRMAAKGAEPATIAKAFAVTERHVRQRLRLAQLPDPAIEALRAGGITLDQAAALTTAPTEAAALAELARVNGQAGYGYDANAIRQSLARSTATAGDRRAIFVTLDKYRAEGGRVQDDLFTDRTLLLDGDLLDTLFRAQLDDCAAFVSGRGWKWVQPHYEPWLSYSVTDGLQRISRQPIDLPEADAAELEDLLARAETDELTPAELARMDELEERAAGEVPEADMTTSGIYLYVDNTGTLITSEAFRRTEDDPARQADPGSDDTAFTVKPESKALPESLRTDLSRIRLAALQNELADWPDLTLYLLAWMMQTKLWSFQGPLQITFNPAPLEPEKTEGFTLPARLAADHLPGLDSGGGGDADPAAFAAFRNLGEVNRDQILQLGLSRLLRDGPLAAALAHKIDPDPRRIWTPTAAGYFSRLRAAALDPIWTALVPDDRDPTHAKFAALKKAEKAQLLHRLFNEADFRELLGLSRDQNAAIDQWLPAELQWPAPEEAPEGAYPT
jgi:ParB family chromosome partitioning protein